MNHDSKEQGGLGNTEPHEYRLLARIAALERLVEEAVPCVEFKFNLTSNDKGWSDDDWRLEAWLARAAEVVSGKAGPSEYGQPKKEPLKWDGLCARCKKPIGLRRMPDGHLRMEEGFMGEDGQFVHEVCEP